MPIVIVKGLAPEPANSPSTKSSEFSQDLIEKAKQIASEKDGYFRITLSEFQATKKADGKKRDTATVDDLQKYIRSALTRGKVEECEVYVPLDNLESVSVAAKDRKSVKPAKSSAGKGRKKEGQP